MRSASLVRTPLDFDLEESGRLLYERKVEDHDLKSVIQYEERFIIENDVRVVEFLAIHQSLSYIPDLREEAGRYYVGSVESIRTEFSRFCTLPGLMVVDTLRNRGIVSEIINQGVTDDLVQNIYLDTPRIARDHKDHWQRRFKDRAGRVQRGALYGDSVEMDSIFGPELNRSTTGTVGWFTNFFNSLVKIKASPKGSVTLFLNPDTELFLRFLRAEIIPYCI